MKRKKVFDPTLKHKLSNDVDWWLQYNEKYIQLAGDDHIAFDFYKFVDELSKSKILKIKLRLDIFPKRNGKIKKNMIFLYFSSGYTFANTVSHDRLLSTTVITRKDNLKKHDIISVAQNNKIIIYKLQEDTIKCINNL